MICFSSPCCAAAGVETGLLYGNYIWETTAAITHWVATGGPEYDSGLIAGGYEIMKVDAGVEPVSCVVLHALCCMLAFFQL